MDADQEELFQSIILDHDARPQSFFRMDDATHVESGLNPVCGDRFVIFLELEGDRIKRASFYGRGCTLSKASASMMMTLVPGKSLQEARVVRDAIWNALASADVPQLEGDLAALVGVREHPSRIACVMLAWDAMVAAIEKGTSV